MGTTDSNRLEKNDVLGQVTRFVIVSYFLGIGLGFFPGSRVDKVFLPFTTGDGAFIMAGGLIFGFVALILLNIQRKLAAGGLGLLVFLASYIELVSATGSSEQIGIFWRDLGAIGLLMFSVGDRHRGETMSDVQKTQKSSVAPAEQAPDTAERAPRHPRRVKTEIYRQDFEVVRVH